MVISVDSKLNTLNMCSNTVHHSSTSSSSFNRIVDPFPFSTFHFLRTCNRLLIPTDLRPYYNLTKSDEIHQSNDCLSENNKIMIPNTNHEKSDLCSSINDIFPRTDSPEQNMSIKLPSLISSIATGSIPPQSSASHSRSGLSFDYPSNSTTDAEFPLGSYNRISELNYSSLMSRRQRGEKRPIPDEQKDEKYYERRKRNNEAAKKSRDARKLREDRIAFRAAILEQENAILRAQLIALREEMTTMRQIMGTRPAQISVNL